MKRDHVRMSDVHGLQRLAVAATLGVTDLVEALHRTIIDAPLPVGKSRGGRTTGLTGLAYKSVRGATRVVGAGADAIFGRLAAIGGDRASSPEREAVLAALNGVLGDYLAETHNPLAISMRVRKGGVTVPITRDALGSAFAQPARDVAVLLHGLCMSDLTWLRDGHDHGAALAADLGFTPVYVHYDTGLSIAGNGGELDALMHALVRAWPGPIERLVFIGHSMGGLVARSAMEAAVAQRRAWIERVDACVFLGTPHRGAPLERAGAWVDYLAAISPYSAPFARLGQLRSAGIQDLRHGPKTTTPLPTHVEAYAIAASLQKAPRTPGRRARGDGLVSVSSALGMEMPESHRYVAYGTGHLGLLSSRRAYERMRAWLETPNASGISSTTR